MSETAETAREHGMSPAAGERPLVLFDGTCGLCDRAVQFILKRDRRERFRFAPLQSEPGRQVLEEAGLRADYLDSLVLVQDGKIYTRSAAALRIARGLPWPWPATAVLLAVPRFLRDAAYDFVARRRIRWFGTVDACRLPDPATRDRFLA